MLTMGSNPILYTNNIQATSLISRWLFYLESTMKEPRVYGSRWAKARAAFLRDNPLCVMCQQQGRIEAATVVDHIEPHRLKEALMSGNVVQIAKAQKLFWDRKNWQSLCTPHHSSTKQRQEKSGHVTGCTDDGMPIDPNSHWNR